MIVQFPTTEMVEDKVWIAAYGLIHPEWSDSVIASDIKKNHNIDVNAITFCLSTWFCLTVWGRQIQGSPSSEKGGVFGDYYAQKGQTKELSTCWRVERSKEAPKEAEGNTPKSCSIHKRKSKCLVHHFTINYNSANAHSVKAKAKRRLFFLWFHLKTKS